MLIVVDCLYIYYSHTLSLFKFHLKKHPFLLWIWWRHQMEAFSALLTLCAGNSPITSEFHAQRPVTRSFDVFFDLRPNKRLSKQSWGWWFETPSRSLWRHCDGCYATRKSIYLTILQEFNNSYSIIEILWWLCSWIIRFVEDWSMLCNDTLKLHSDSTAQFFSEKWCVHCLLAEWHCEIDDWCQY